MQRSQWIAAVALLLVAVGLLLGRWLGDEPTDTVTTATSAASAVEPAASPIEPAAGEPARLGQAQQFVGLDGWLQTDADNLDDFDGRVRIVQFWTFGCYNCKATLPHLQEIYNAYRDDGVEILGVHAAEFDYEKDPAAIEAAANDLGVTWPIALDTNKTNFRRWQPGRRFWPRTFVVDQAGEIRFDHIGEGRYDELAATVAYLVENGP